MIKLTNADSEAVCGSFLAISTIVVALRFLARRQQRAEWKFDDWATVAALVRSHRDIYVLIMLMLVDVLDRNNHHNPHE